MYKDFGDFVIGTPPTKKEWFFVYVTRHKKHSIIKDENIYKCIYSGQDVNEAVETINYAIDNYNKEDNYVMLNNLKLILEDNMKITLYRDNKTNSRSRWKKMYSRTYTK